MIKRSIMVSKVYIESEIQTFRTTYGVTVAKISGSTKKIKNRGSNINGLRQPRVPNLKG